MMRKKDNPGMRGNSKIIKELYIKNGEELLEKKGYIVRFCEVFNARASINLNVRSYKKVALRMVRNMAEVISNEDGYKSASRAFSRAAGQVHLKDNVKWIVDVDNETDVSPTMVYYIINKCHYLKSFIYEAIPSKTGHHLITAPFNVKAFQDKYPNVDIHKDNPTNLYIP
jgi:hypothetical protein